MRAEILMIGTELLLGQIEDSNAGRIARALAANGVNLYWKTTVGDNHARLCDALERGLERSDAILCSGGLGPTQDDITRECVAQVLGTPQDYHEDLFQVIVERFRNRNRPLSDNNRRQAMLPRGAAPIHNPNGTAPGIIAECDRGVIICMPGVPVELDAMLHGAAIPYLRWKFGVAHTIYYRVLKVHGMGESRVDAAMGDMIAALENPTVGLLASPDAVRVRIAARAPDRVAAETLIAPVAEEIKRRLAPLATALAFEPDRD